MRSSRHCAFHLHLNHLIIQSQEPCLGPRECFTWIIHLPTDTARMKNNLLVLRRRQGTFNTFTCFICNYQNILCCLMATWKSILSCKVERTKATPFLSQTCSSSGQDHPFVIQSSSKSCFCRSLLQPAVEEDAWNIVALWKNEKQQHGLLPILLIHCNTLAIYNLYVVIIFSECRRSLCECDKSWHPVNELHFK